MSDTNPKQPVPYTNFVLEQVNQWRGQLINNLSSYHEIRALCQKDPTAVLVTPDGRRIPYRDLMEARRRATLEARERVTALEAMLARAEAGTLEAMWSDAELPEPSGLHVAPPDMRP